MGIYLYNGEGNLVHMGDGQSENDENNSDTRGLEFAITLIAAFGSIAYAIYAYFQANPVDSLVFSLVRILIPGFLILPIGLILYVIIKGYSIECNNECRKLDKLLSGYYKSLFFMSILVLLLLLLFILLAVVMSFFVLLAVVSLVLSRYIDNLIYLIAIFLVILIIICIKYDLIKYTIKFGTHLKKFIAHSIARNTDVAILLFVGLIFWAILFPYAPYILQGHITIDMESVYYKSDEQIPVLIQVTGPDTVLSVKLSNITKDNNLNARAFIEKLEPYPNQKIGHDNSLIGYPLSSGKYIVFINTTNLSTGYYKLEFTRAKNNLSDAKGFYLSDDSKTQINKAVTAASHYNV